MERSNIPDCRNGFLIEPGQVDLIIEKALQVLEKSGARFESPRALKILKENGAIVDFGTKRARFKADLVRRSLETVPPGVVLYDREAQKSCVIGGSALNFAPGSSVVSVLDRDGRTIRPSLSLDMVLAARICDKLPNISLQSTALVCNDIPNQLGDCFRLYLALKYSAKPVVTGAFSIPGLGVMRDLLAAVRGGYRLLEEKPMAIFDVCPSPPLKWSEISSSNIIDCARFKLPAQVVSLPMPGAASPVTLAGSLVVHIAENLSGIVLSQCANPGAPVIFGGAPVQFDMRYGTTPFSAVEAVMIGAASASIGKALGLPTQTFAALSDSTVVDAQAGLETALGAAVAAQSDINLVTGPGILSFAGCFSPEKLVIDDEICGMALRLRRGIDFSPECLAVELIERLGPGGVYLEEEHTYRWFKREPYTPSKIIDRRSKSARDSEAKREILERAKEKIDLIITEKGGELPDGQVLSDLRSIVNRFANEQGLENLFKDIKPGL